MFSDYVATTRELDTDKFVLIPFYRSMFSDGMGDYTIYDDDAHVS
jgi:hypothetical protein